MWHNTWWSTDSPKKSTWFCLLTSSKKLTDETSSGDLTYTWNPRRIYIHQDSMYGSWIYFAIANFIFIAIALIWGMPAQLSSRSTTFAVKRQNIFEEYSHRKMKELLSFRATDAPQASALRRTFLKPFNSQDAFFFPSAFLIASLLSFMSFIYILFQSIQVRRASESVGMCRNASECVESRNQGASLSVFSPLFQYMVFQFCSSPW